MNTDTTGAITAEMLDNAIEVLVTSKELEWVETECKSKSCRGLRIGGKGFTTVCQKGTEDRALCNECYCR